MIRQIRWFKPLLVILLLIIVSMAFVSYQRQRHLEAIRVLGRLAPFPETAQHILVYANDGLFSSQWYARFDDSPESIERFLSASPSIQSQKSTVWSNQRTFYTSPSWFDVRGIRQGRYFNISLDQNNSYGIIIVDDERNTAYIYVSYS